MMSPLWIMATPKGDFQCGYCSSLATKGIFCEKHAHIWLCIDNTHRLVISKKVSQFNSKWFPSHVDKKKLQHDINKVVIYGGRLFVV